MIRIATVTKIGAVCATVTLAGAAAASGTSSPNPPLPAHKKAMIVSGVVGGGHDHSYVPITPCRVVDSNQSTGGNLQANVARTFKVAGTSGFLSQGGTDGGCGIPTTASAVTATISGTNTVGKGYLRAWAAGYTEPNATSLLLQAGVEHFTGLTMPISSSGVTVRPVNAKTRFVMDVTGYYKPSVYGVISSDGTVYQSSQLSLSSHSSTGSYTLYSPVTVGTCSIQATAWSNYRAEAYASGNYIYATVTDAAGNLTNAYFQVTATC